MRWAITGVIGAGRGVRLRALRPRVPVDETMTSMCRYDFARIYVETTDRRGVEAVIPRLPKGVSADVRRSDEWPEPGADFTDWRLNIELAQQNEHRDHGIVEAARTTMAALATAGFGAVLSAPFEDEVGDPRTSQGLDTREQLPARPQRTAARYAVVVEAAEVGAAVLDPLDEVVHRLGGAGETQLPSQATICSTSCKGPPE